MENIKPYNSLIDAFLEEIKKQSLSLKKPRGFDPSKKESYEKRLKSIADLRGRPSYYPYISSGIGRGPLVQLLDGSVKLDFICGIGPHILGHSHLEILKNSLCGALEDAVMQGHLQFSSIYQEFLEKLISIASRKSRLSHAWVCPSGSMANENALKAIRQKKEGARTILAFEKAFAGRTTLMAEVTDNPSIKEGLPSYGEVLRVPFSPLNPQKALETLKQHWNKKGEDLACFMVELMQGDGGCHVAPREFFLPLFEFCREKKIAIWVDEIQTFARSGEFFAFEKLNLGEYVDVCTIGKSLQLSASLWTKEYNPKPGLVSGTFASSSTSFHSALAILKILDEKNYMGEQGKISQIYKKWEARLKILEQESLVSEIEGWGLMIGVTPLGGQPEMVNKLLHLLFQKGLICYSCGSHLKKRLRFLLPAIVEEEHLDQALEILRDALLELKKN